MHRMLLLSVLVQFCAELDKRLFNALLQNHHDSSVNIVRQVGVL